MIKDHQLLMRIQYLLLLRGLSDAEYQGGLAARHFVLEAALVVAADDLRAVSEGRLVKHRPVEGNPALPREGGEDQETPEPDKRLTLGERLGRCLLTMFVCSSSM